MEDFKLILYVLAIVAYFIYNAWRKAFKTPDEDGRPDASPKERPQRERPARDLTTQERPAPRPIPAAPSQPRQARPAVPATSFEDILREMQSKMERANEQHKAPVEKPKPVLQPITQPVAKTEPRRTLSLEDPEQARAYELQRRERLATAEASRQTKMQSRKTAPNQYAELLQNPATIRQAFIMSEIFNRKQY